MEGHFEVSPGGGRTLSSREEETLPDQGGIIASAAEGRRELEKVLQELTFLPDLEKGRKTPLALGLEGIRGLLDGLGLEPGEAPAVHLAGSKGKGTTALFLESLFQGAGLRTGVYLSPHLAGLEERFRVGGAHLGPGAAASLLRRAARVLPHAPGATFFDLLTAAAFLLFHEAGVEAACLETGLGGRLDSTNAVVPRITVVTTVEREHEDVLGQGLGRVAREKAGILKPGVPLVTGCRGRALAILEERARRLGAPVWVLGRDFQVFPRERTEGGWILELHFARGGRRVFPSGRLSRPQVQSLALAAQAFALFGGKEPEERILVEAGRRVLPGRFEVWEGERGTWVLDGAHTERSLLRLAKDVEEWFPGRKRTLLFGVAPDKRWFRAFRLLSRRSERTWVVDLPGERRVPAEVLAEAAPGGARAWPSVEEALAALPEETGPGDLVCVTGSFRLVGRVRVWLQESSEWSERRRNE